MYEVKEYPVGQQVLITDEQLELRRKMKLLDKLCKEVWG